MSAKAHATTSDPFRLDGLTALVTGASSGIGRGIADGFIRAGAQVYYHARSHDQASSAARAGGGLAIACDLADGDQIDAMCDDLINAGVHIDILVNNAGVEIPAALKSLEDEVLRATLDVNLLAPIHLARRLLPLLTRSAHGSVLNISSIHDRVPSHSNAAYASSKAALRMATETLAVELGPQAIRVNAIAPGAIATDINRAIIASVGETAFADLIPLGRVGTVDDVVGPAIFLASDAARYITGATLVVDGAYSHHLVRYRGLGAH